MTAMALSLNGLRVLSATISIPWREAWVADLDIDPDDVSQVPTSGPGVLTVGSTPATAVTLAGTIDPRFSGSFIASGRGRVGAGAGGWGTTVGRASWHNDAGVVSALVYQQTAGAVGERVNVPNPVRLGNDFLRFLGPAARVLGDQDWYVDLTGTTQVASWPTPTPDASLQLLDWNPNEQRAELACDTLVLPGTVLSDPRLNGASPVVRDVEQRFDKDGSHVTAWCSSAPVSRLRATLKVLVREWAGVTYLRIYRYRFVQNTANRLSLQAVTPGAPDVNPIAEGTGMAGVLANLAPGTIVYVGFVNGDKTDPIVLSYDGSKTPLELDLAGGSDFVALAALVHTELEKIATCFGSFVPGTGGANFPVASLYGGAVPVGSVAAERVKAT